MRRIPALVVVMVGAVSLAACGRAGESATAPAATVATMATTAQQPAPPVAGTAVTVAPAITTTATVAMVVKRDDPKVRAKVAAIDAAFKAKYKPIIDAGLAMGGTMTTGEARIDEAIDEACEAASRGFAPKPDDAGMLTMLFGKLLADNGHDVAGFIADIAKANREIAKLVGC